MAAVLGAVAVVLVAAGAAWWALIGPGSDVPVPSTSGLDRPAAQQALADAGLASEVSERFDEQVPAGTVIGTSPDEGAPADRDDVVQLFVSRGSELSLVPDVVGSGLPAARDAVEQVGLTLEEDEPDYDEQVPEGSVVSQDPGSGQELRRGDAVRVVVSQGREPLDVPDVVGRSREDAVAAVQSAGLDAVVGEESSDDVDEGDVVRQSPEDGTLFGGDDVQLVVSLGPELVPVPDVVGQQLEEARARLEDAGLAVEEESVLGGFFGTVREQSVEAGTEVEPGTTVTLTVV